MISTESPTIIKMTIQSTHNDQLTASHTLLLVLFRVSSDLIAVYCPFLHVQLLNMSTSIEGIQTELRSWLTSINRDRIVSQLSSLLIRDMIYVYINYRYPADAADFLSSDSVQIANRGNNSTIVGLVVDDRDTVQNMNLLSNLDTVIVHSVDKIDQVREQLPDVNIVLDADYRYLNTVDNSSRITDVLAVYPYEELGNSTYQLL